MNMRKVLDISIMAYYPFDLIGQFNEDSTSGQLDGTYKLDGFRYQKAKRIDLPGALLQKPELIQSDGTNAFCNSLALQPKQMLPFFQRNPSAYWLATKTITTDL